MSNLEAEAVDFEPGEDDFIDEDVGASDLSTPYICFIVFCFVCLWRVGCDECLATFSHHNFGDFFLLSMLLCC
uniref:Uncharacterized protein n=1 Tax=Brassica oleracea TaxID=3712 RepID=A0A3P6G500_BRAOL|nr:unnamed protein product [Brassica oleracea]